MTQHNLFYYPYASFTKAQLPLLKVAALWFDKLVILDQVGASWDTIGADHIARDALWELKDAGIPGAEWLFDWRDGKKSVQENGLHYLLKT